MTENQVSTCRVCPLCGSGYAYQLVKMDFAIPYDSVLPSQYRIVQCGQCGFVYDDVDVGADTFARYYASAGKYVQKGVGGSGDITPVDRERYQGIIDFISPELSGKDVRIVDVGCGKGGLLRVFRENGYARLCAIEPSEGCVELMRKEFGLEAICATITDLPRGRKFDLVSISNVFEHLYTVHDAVEAIDGIVEIGGLVYVDVPDGSRYWQYFYAPWYSFDMEHINHFDVSSMSALWTQHGYRCVKSAELVGTPVPGRHVPMCRVLLQKVSNAKGEGHAVLCSPCLGQGIEQFITCSRQAEAQILSLAEIKGPICFWGCGAYAKWLLKWGNSHALHRPSFIFDAGVSISGSSTIEGVPLVSPKDFERFATPDSAIVVTSVLYERQIVEGLRKRGWTGRIYSASTGTQLV